MTTDASNQNYELKKKSPFIRLNDLKILSTENQILSFKILILLPLGLG
jgi:phosphoribosyl-dephospho-CoA transferase